MKLIVHVTRDNLSVEQATELYAEIKKCLAEKWPDNPDRTDGLPYLHVNGQTVGKFPGSHETGLPEAPGEI